ncbi:MAG: hypothetical protein ACRENW_04320 [Thermodesulfobacteriota bacterium]
METIKLKITGTRPLLMHSDILCNSLHPLAKNHAALVKSNKAGNKTDEKTEEVAKSEWVSGLYFDEKLGPYVPGVNIESAIVAGGKLQRLGAQLKRAVEVMDERCPLIYTGPRTVEGLWGAGFYDARSVKVTTSRITRYRPLFRDWSFVCEIMFDPDMINRDQLVKCAVDAGLYVGIGDYRPKFGRFTVEIAA